MPAPPTLLTLPRELRFNIYTHLTSLSLLSTPCASFPTLSLFPLPPPSALLRTCTFLHTEISSWFLPLATPRLIAVAFDQIYAAPNYTSCLAAVRLAKKVEVVLVWKINEEQIDWSLDFWPWEIEKSVRELVGFLEQEAERLEEVVVQVRNEGDEVVSGEAREQMAGPLRGLAGRVRMVEGEVKGLEEDE